MKAEYDFSKGTRGRFHHPNAVFSFPVYLEPDVDDLCVKLEGGTLLEPFYSSERRS